MPHTPRFRALALFGRRLSERADGLGMPASENLHTNGKQNRPPGKPGLARDGVAGVGHRIVFGGS
jgi:hypothetical protein